MRDFEGDMTFLWIEGVLKLGELPVLVFFGQFGKKEIKYSLIVRNYLIKD